MRDKIKFYNPMRGRWEGPEEKRRRRRILSYTLFIVLGILAIGALVTGLIIGLTEDSKRTFLLKEEPKLAIKEIDFTDPDNNYSFSGDGINNDGKEIESLTLTIFGNEITFSEEDGTIFPEKEGEERIYEHIIPDENGEELLKFQFTFKRTNGVTTLTKIDYRKPVDYKVDEEDKVITTDFKEKIQTFESTMDSTKYFHSNGIKVKFLINGELFEEDVYVEPTQSNLIEKEITKTISVQANDEIAKRDVEINLKLKVQPKNKEELGTKESPITHYQYDAIIDIIGGSEKKYNVEGVEEQVSNSEKETNLLFSKIGTRLNEFVNPFVYAYEQIDKTRGSVSKSIVQGVLESELPVTVFSLYNTKLIRDQLGGITGYDDKTSNILEAIEGDFTKPNAIFTKDDLIEARKGKTSKEIEETINVFGSGIYDNVENSLYHVDKVFGDNREYTVRLFFTYGRNYDDIEGVHPDHLVGTRAQYSKYLLYGYGISLTDKDRITNIVTQRTPTISDHVYDNIANYAIYDETPIIIQQVSTENLSENETTRIDARSLDRREYKQIGLTTRISGGSSNITESYYTLEIEKKSDRVAKDGWTTDLGLETVDRTHKTSKPNYHRFNDDGFRVPNYQKVIAHPPFELNTNIKNTENLIKCSESKDPNTPLVNAESGITKCGVEDSREYSFRVYKVNYPDKFGVNESAFLLGFVVRMRIDAPAWARQFYEPVINLSNVNEIYIDPPF